MKTALCGEIVILAGVPITGVIVMGYGGSDRTENVMLTALLLPRYKALGQPLREICVLRLTVMVPAAAVGLNSGDPLAKKDSEVWANAFAEAVKLMKQGAAGAEKTHVVGEKIPS